MKGNMKVWIVVATWVLLNAVVGPAWACLFVLIMVATWNWWKARPVVRRARVCLSEEVAEQPTYNYEIVTFTTARATVKSYKRFIRALRAQLASREVSHGIPVMRERSTVRDSQRFVLVELSNSAADSPVTLAVDVTNAYVVAYRTGRRSFLLREAIFNPFPGTERPKTLPPFSSNYIDLQKWGGNRGAIHLGMGALEKAITALRNSNTKGEHKARSLIVVIQMVAEAARFGYIEERVRESIPRPLTFVPDAFMLSLENKWEDLSKAIQQSDQQGVFLRRVELRSITYEPVYVDSVQDCRERSKLAIMLFVPTTDGQPSPHTRGRSSRARSSRPFPRNRS